MGIEQQALKEALAAAQQVGRVLLWGQHREGERGVHWVAKEQQS